MMKIGIVSELRPTRSEVRVKFNENQITSYWLPVVVSKSQSDKFFSIPDIGEQVVCLMDENLEFGVVIGAIYSDEDLPGSGVSENINRVVFEDGSKVSFDRSSSELSIETGTTQITVSPAGVDISRGGETLKSILSDFLTAASVETHPASGSPPTNAADYIAIKSRLENLFS